LVTLTSTLASMTRSVIVAAVRTPFGKLGGGLASHRATELGAIAIRVALERAGIEPGEPQYVIMGQVLQGGAGPAPARQAAVGAVRIVEQAWFASRELGISREDQDAWALRSHRRAIVAQEAGRFDDEIVPVGEVHADEGPRRDTSPEKLASLKPVFDPEGTTT